MKNEVDNLNQKKEFGILNSIKSVKSTIEELKEYHKELLSKFVQVKSGNKSKRFLQKTILNVIYPATTLFSPQALKGKDLNEQQTMTLKDEVYIYNKEGLVESSSIDSEIELKAAKRISFYTDDHQKLDGCMIYGDPNNHNLKDKKVMVMALGNAFTWQQGYLHAKLMAEKYQCNVMIYNPRGIGKSSGETEFIQDAVTDCKGAIQYALKHCCTNKEGEIDAKKLSLYGHSLGGGVSAVALQELIQEKKINSEGIGLYINHHSFSSLSGFVKGIGKFAKPLGAPSRLFLAMGGHNRLRAKRAIVNTRLATRVVVATGKEDDMMGKAGRLMDNLRKEEAKKKEIANQVLYVTIPDYGHHEEEEYLRDEIKLSKSEHKKVQKSEIQTNEELIREEKLNQLKSYHNAIQGWVKE